MTATHGREADPACTCGHRTAPAEPQAFVSTRTALIFAIAFLCAIVVGALTFMAYGNVPGAVLAGLGTMGGALVGLHLLIR